MAQRERKNRSTNMSRAVASSSTVRIEVPKSRGRQPKQKMPTVVLQPPVVSGFIDFLREHTIVTLAVGFVVGTQVQTVVKQLVASFISPAFSLLFGNNLVKETFTWHFRGRAGDFGWGSFVYVLLNFFFVLLAIYLIIKLLKLDKLDRPKV